MKKKTMIIIMIVFIITISVSIIYNTFPRLQLNGSQTQYELMKKMLEADIPVIWGLYSFFSGKNKGLMLYSFKNGAYIERGTTRAHYVTATGIVEKMGENEPHRRMVRVSSWGEELYVDFDEYESFRLGKGEKFFKRVFCICNRIGSNILKIEIK